MSYTNRQWGHSSIADTSFRLYKGPYGGHGASTIVTFVANSEQPSYNGNLLDFLPLLRCIMKA